MSRAPRGVVSRASKVVDLLRDGPATAGVIALALGISGSEAANTLSSLYRQKKIERVGVVDRPPSPNNGPKTTALWKVRIGKGGVGGAPSLSAPRPPDPSQDPSGSARAEWDAAREKGGAS